MDPIKEAFQKIKQDIDSLRLEIIGLKDELSFLKKILINHKESLTTNNQQTDSSTDISSFKALKSKNNSFSTGNKGVSTDRQTVRQTDRQLKTNEFKEAKELIDSLDQIKERIMINFKNLTQQELLVFSTIYLLEQENKTQIDYFLLSKRLNLTESSIRDYVTRLIKKDIPINKTKINNKKIVLSLSKELKEIINFSTINNFNLK
jgi:hypothetical protein